MSPAEQVAKVYNQHTGQRNRLGQSHRSGQQEFYQILSYKDGVDLEAKLSEWESCYNFSRPHGAFNGKTPYEALRERL